MMDTAQVLLLVVLIFLSVLLVVLGIQVFFILQDLRKTVKKANKVLDDTSMITESISGPVATLSAVISGVKTGSSIAKLLQNRKRILRHLSEGEDE
jgi:uncharacterized protein YoxC